MKTILKYQLINLGFILALSIMIFGSCNNCEDIVVNPCGEDPVIIPNGEYCGWSVATCFGPEGQPVGVIYNTSNNHSAPRGDVWAPPEIHPPTWTSNSIGQIFGVAIDNSNSDIYLASSDVYYIDSPSPLKSGNTSRPYSCGQIFKCSPPSWDAIPFADIPNSCDDGNAIGNIVYDSYNDQLFATNLEDGMIYRIEVATASIIDTYDPFGADDGSSGICGQDERVWSIAINQDRGALRLYFPRISSSGRELYSLELVNGAFPPSGTEVLEYSGLNGSQNKITDIAMDSDGMRMLLAERGAAHTSITQSLDLGTSGWMPSGTTYYIGGITGENSAGGVDFAYTSSDSTLSKECDQYFWNTGNALTNRATTWAYGMEAIEYQGNNPTTDPMPLANQDTDLFVDFDPSTQDKGGLGDVEVFDCTECSVIDPCLLNDFPK